MYLCIEINQAANMNSVDKQAIFALVIMKYECASNLCMYNAHENISAHIIAYDIALFGKRKILLHNL